jgi:hypothetical protein
VDKGKIRDKFWNIIHRVMKGEVMNAVLFMMRQLNDLKWIRTRIWLMLPISWPSFKPRKHLKGDVM